MAFKPTDYLPYDFANRRHIGPSPEEMDEMLSVVGASDLDALIDDTLPSSIRQKEPLEMGRPLSERELLHRMREVAGKNKLMKSLIGQGYHGTVTPPAIQRNILENPAWYTAYTPYQPEISQGRLEALLNFQTMVSDLTGLEIANASLLDESTACAEAMTMAQRVSKSKAKAFFVDRDCHPQNIAVVQTRAAPLGIEVIVGNPDKMNPEEVFGALFQYPGTYGHVRDFTPQIAALHETRALGIVIADVSGKGIAASLIMAMCRSVIRANAAYNHSPANVLRAANRQLFPDIREDMFISLAYAILDKRSDELLIARAGHDPPLHFVKESGEIHPVKPKGIAIGIDDGDVFDRAIALETVKLAAGDSFLLYTDGVNEALDVHGDEFGMERLRSTFRIQSAKSAAGLLEGITAEIRGFVGQAAQNDDITLIAIQKH